MAKINEKLNGKGLNAILQPDGTVKVEAAAKPDDKEKGKEGTETDKKFAELLPKFPEGTRDTLKAAYGEMPIEMKKGVVNVMEGLDELQQKALSKVIEATRPHIKNVKVLSIAYQNLNDPAKLKAEAEKNPKDTDLQAAAGLLKTIAADPAQKEVFKLFGVEVSKETTAKGKEIPEKDRKKMKEAADKAVAEANDPTKPKESEGARIIKAAQITIRTSVMVEVGSDGKTLTAGEAPIQNWEKMLNKFVGVMRLFDGIKKSLKPGDAKKEGKEGSEAVDKRKAGMEKLKTAGAVAKDKDGKPVPEAEQQKDGVEFHLEKDAASAVGGNYPVFKFEGGNWVWKGAKQTNFVATSEKYPKTGDATKDPKREEWNKLADEVGGTAAAPKAPEGKAEDADKPALDAFNKDNTRASVDTIPSDPKSIALVPKAPVTRRVLEVRCKEAGISFEQRPDMLVIKKDPAVIAKLPTLKTALNASDKITENAEQKKMRTLRTFADALRSSGLNISLKDSDDSPQKIAEKIISEIKKNGKAALSIDYEGGDLTENDDTHFGLTGIDDVIIKGFDIKLKTDPAAVIQDIADQNWDKGRGQMSGWSKASKDKIPTLSKNISDLLKGSKDIYVDEK